MEITNNNKPNGTSNYNGICVLAGPGFENGDAYIVSNLLVENSSIHNCGDDAHEHSLYLEGTRNPVIRDNYLYGNYGIGLDLYPDTQGMLAEYNVIDGNSRGGKENVGFAGEVAGGEYRYDHASSNNVVRYSLITNALQRYNVDSYYPSSKVLPTGNLVSDNCVWNAPYGNYGYDHSSDYSQSNNKSVDPLYLDPANADFRLQPGSPCTGWGPRTKPATVSQPALTATTTTAPTTTTTTTATTTVPTSDFTLAATPTSQSVTRGRSASYAISLLASGAFSGTATPAVNGLPAGATGTFSAGSIDASTPVTLTVGTSTATPRGTYSITVSATSGSTTRSIALTLQIKRR
jgi:hypothetical protein